MVRNAKQLDAFSEEIPMLTSNDNDDENVCLEKKDIDLWKFKSEADDLGKYDDFHTIDWSRDRVRDRLRLRQVKKLKHNGNFVEKIKGFHDAYSGWLIAFIVGATTGFVGGMIDIGTDWMIDLKEGFCKHEFWFNKKACCWNSEIRYGQHYCAKWMLWSDILGVKNISSSGLYTLNLFCYVMVAVTFASISVTLVRFYAPYSCGSGIAEIKTILGGFVIRGFLGWWTLIIKSFTLILSVASGLKLGKEGPMVHVAACIGNVLARFFPKFYGNESKRREVLSAAAAAGVSVAFGAPVGGVLFSLEEVSYYFPLKTLWRTFFCAMIAALTFGYMNPYGNGTFVMFYVNYHNPWQPFELVPFIFLGVFGGWFGSIFNKCNIFWCRLRKTTRLGNHPVFEVLVTTVLTVLISYPNEFTRDSASRVIYRLFQKCGPEDTSSLCDYIYFSNGTQHHINSEFYPHRSLGPGVHEAIWKLLLAMVFTSVLTVFTFGMKVPTGVFVPSLFIGACGGRVLGIGMEMLVDSHSSFFLWSGVCSKMKNHCIVPGLYAMTGAAATLGGVTRMTVSLVVIMFELTGGLTYIVPLMVSIMVSKWVGDALGTEGIYDEHIRLNGYPYLDVKEEFTHPTLAADVMNPRKNTESLVCIAKNGFTVADIENLLEETNFNGFPVIMDKESQTLAGFVTRRDLKVALQYGKMRKKNFDSGTRVYFSKRTPKVEQSNRLTKIPLSLRHILDSSPFTVTVATPMETVVDMFRKLGLRQLLVTRNGKLLGIITKKDVLRHIAEMKHLDPGHILFN
ncbi:H(+)/Cl(-) exchange transporter 5 isoform X1 [Hydra vulgaris]|uniref:H(+)/Cl(-) exchange transporter 5 isoform X1 n=1 Tax=Hydra vulgaris TaxID=6087 RepID=UPI001F5FB772|nr:H(+)/Cl(-) exchange transporter 5 isoform X1 [Hydra vulgaris]